MKSVVSASRFLSSKYYVQRGLRRGQRLDEDGVCCGEYRRGIFFVRDLGQCSPISSLNLDADGVLARKDFVVEIAGAAFFLIRDLVQPSPISSSTI